MQIADQVCVTGLEDVVAGEALLQAARSERVQAAA